MKTGAGSVFRNYLARPPDQTDYKARIANRGSATKGRQGGEGRGGPEQAAAAATAGAQQAGKAAY